MSKIDKIFSWLVLFLIISAGVIHAAGINFDNEVTKGCESGNSKTTAWGCTMLLNTTSNSISTALTSNSMNDLVEAGNTCTVNNGVVQGGSICDKVVNSAGFLQYALQATMEPKEYLTPPLSFQYYVNNKLNNTIIAQPVYAETFGGGALDVVYAVWQYFRNLAYLVFVVVIIVVGFMVMFRKQIDPHTIVTVQSAIPNFFIVLLLITFSYGIGSLAVSSIGPLYGALKNVGSLGVFNYQGLFMILISAIVVGLFSGSLPIVGISLMIMFLVILVCIFIAMILYGVEYLKRLVKLVMLTVLGPVILLFGAIPGQGHFIGHWFKALLANVLALPFMYVVLKIGIMLIVSIGENVAVYDIGAGILHIIMGIIVMFWSAKIPKLVEEMFGYDGSLIPTDPKRH